MEGTKGSMDAMASRLDDATPGLLEEHRTPGASVALVQGAEVVWSGHYGVREAATPEPVTEGTVFEAASMSKPVFAYAAMKLVEEGRLDLDTPLVEYLDEPYLPDEPLHLKITGRMVLNHTTGLPNWREGSWRNGDPLHVEFEPGSRYGYSGEGIWYLQQVVEHIEGENLEPWIRRRLLEPLGMTDSSYIWQSRYEEASATGHTEEGEPKSRPHYDRANAAFSLYTTAVDYGRFLGEALTADGSRRHSLRRETVEAMLTPAVAMPEGGWQGLGWRIGESASRVRYGFHSGTNGSGFRCYSRFYPATGCGFVVMTNGLGGGGVCEGIAQLVEELQPDAAASA